MPPASTEQPETPDRLGALRRAALVAAGWSSLALAGLGVALPLLPTTPFVLLGAACFARSSPRLHRALLESPRLGPYLRQWRRDRSVPPRAKRRASVLVVATFALSITLAEGLWLRVALSAVGLTLLALLARLRTVGAPVAAAAPEELPTSMP